MKQALFTITFFFALTSYADRGLYSCEIVSGAHVIGIWNKAEIKGKLNPPQTFLKGDSKIFTKAKIDPAHIEILKNQVAGDKILLFISIYDSSSHVRLLSWSKKTFEESLKTTRAILKQMELTKHWSNLSINEKITKSDLIVSGQVKDSGKSCPIFHFITPEKSYKGILPKHLSVITIDENKLNKKSLILLQKQAGEGPDFRIMQVIAKKDAEKYLKILKK
jgi:hypothetical protein